MSEFDKWLALDIEEIPEAEVSGFEKKAMKKRILGYKRKAQWFTKIAMAAGIFIGASAITAVAFPSLASQIPILEDIVSYFEEDELIFSHFSEVAQPLGLTQTSNGSSVAIEEAVYDGTSVTVSFALQTGTDLGEFPFSSGLLEAAGAGGSGSAISMNKVDETTYAGMITMAPDFLFGTPDTVKLTWKPENFENVETGAKITGDWAFEFKLKALEAEKIPIGETIDIEGGQYTVKELLLTKLSTVLTLDKKGIDEDHYMTEWQLQDDLGNTYPMTFGTGSDRYQQFTFEALDPKASTVIIQPIIKFVENIDDPGVPVKTEPIAVELE